MIEELVYAYLCLHNRGKDNLIKNQDLRNMFEIRSDKSMRQVIQNIRENMKFTDQELTEDSIFARQKKK